MTIECPALNEVKKLETVLQTTERENQHLRSVVDNLTRKLANLSAPGVFLTIKNKNGSKVMTINDDSRPKTASLLRAAIKEFIESANKGGE